CIIPSKMFRIHQTKIIWYQQTWHTIEFSNNKHSRHRIPNPKGSSCFAPEQLFKLTTSLTSVNSAFQACSLRVDFPSVSVRSVSAARDKTLHALRPHAKSAYSPDRRREFRMIPGISPLNQA
ncbi:hypothetical protein, partial [Glutamicibacter soli]